MQIILQLFGKMAYFYLGRWRIFIGEDGVFLFGKMAENHLGQLLPCAEKAVPLQRNYERQIALTIPSALSPK